MREEFEKLPNIAERLNQGGVYWDGEKYTPKPFMISFISTAIFLNGAWHTYREQQKKIEKAVLSLRSEFNLWADDTEQFHAIEAQIEQLEELLK